MTPFTDDDLKRFKNPDEWLDITPEEGLALLARLEAAEVALDHYMDCGPCPESEIKDTLLGDEVNAWRKAAGK